MLIKVSQPNLVQTLKEMNLDPKIQEETNQIYFIFKDGKREFPIFLRIMHEGELVQLLTFIPCAVQNDQINDMARFLHICNKELDMPGFCLDEQSKTVFYRIMIPTSKKELSKDIFEALINTSQVVAKTFASPVEALAVKAMTLDAILQKVQAHASQAK